MVGVLFAGVPAWAGDYTQLELLAHRDPEAALQAIEQQRRAGSVVGTDAAQLHLLAAEAQNQLSQGRLALTEAEAGLTLLGIDLSAPALEPLPVRLVLARANASDLIGETSDMLVPINRLLTRLEGRQPDLQQLLVEALMTRGQLLTTMNDPVGALKDLQRAYTLSDPDDVRAAPGDISAALGNLYTIQFDSENAIIHYKDAVEHYQRVAADVHLSIAVYGMGIVYRDSRNWSEARRYLGWSLELSRQQKDVQGVAYAQKELAGIAIINNELEEAKALLDTAEPLLAEAEDQLALVIVASMRGELASAHRRFDEAASWFDTAEKTAEKFQLQWLAPRIWQKRAEMYANQQDFRAAYISYRKFHDLHEANFRNENSENLQSLRVRFDSELREQQNIVLREQNARQEAALSSQKRQMFLYVAVAALLATLALFLLYALHKGRQLRQRLNAMAHTDELTALPNRRYLMQTAHQEVERARRYQMPLALAVLDLDNFKMINDQFGHAIGDEVLRQFAGTCRTGLRQMDMLGRVGGEEFVLLLPHTGLAEAEPLLQRLREAFRNGNWDRLNGQLQPTVSVGLTELSGVDGGLADLLRRADETLYEAKQKGRNCVIARPAPGAPIQTPGPNGVPAGPPAFEKY